MKKLIWMLITALCILPCASQAKAGVWDELQTNLEQVFVEQMAAQAQPSGKDTVEHQLQVVGERLGRDVFGMPFSLTSQQVVKILYYRTTIAFEDTAYYQFKWERSERLQQLMMQSDARAEEIASLNEYILQDSPEVKEYAAQMRHAIDYAFTQVFPKKYLEGLFDYGMGPSNYNPAKYVRIQDKNKFAKDVQWEIKSLRSSLAWDVECDDQTFRSSWEWLIAENFPPSASAE